MPKAEEVAEVIIGGTIYRDWTSVQASIVFDQATRECVLAVAEPSTGRGWPNLKLRPGDPCEVRLAGVRVLRGFVIKRQAAFSDRQHGVQIIIASKTADLVEASVIGSKGQYKGYTFEQITSSVLKPFGINFKMENAPSSASRKFPDVQLFPGETAWAFIERLARMRNVHLVCDSDGNLVGGAAKGGGSIATLEEGRNLLFGRCVLDDATINSVIEAVGQGKGSDERWGRSVAQMKERIENSAMKRYKPLKIIAEEPGDKQDLKDRGDREKAEQQYTSVDVSVTVQGWLNDDGKLWDVGPSVDVYSPLLFPDDRMNLCIKAVTFAQSSEAGTTTTIDLCLPTALGARQSAPSTGTDGGLFRQST
jgi:prophage tail gpP-like protein